MPLPSSASTDEAALQNALSANPTPPNPMIGKVIGTYRIVRQLGKGGMGAVYEAVHERIGQRAAVKILDPLLSREQKQVDRFFDEARALSLVPHPGLVKLFDFNRLPDSTVYIMMEYLQGESLWNRFQRLRQEGRWLTLAEALRTTRQMASALSAVHQKGIIHRDLKPENVIVVPDPEAAGGERAKLLDFGIAKIAESKGVRRTTVGTTLGTPYYMSPEQCKGSEDLSDRSDVYSLGVMLYEMIAGHPPFENDQGSMIMASHIFREPPSLLALPAPPPEEVAALAHEMLAKEPTKRPDMDQVVLRLGRLITTGPSAEVDPALISKSLQMTLPPVGIRTAAQATTRKQPAQLQKLGLGVALLLLVVVGLSLGIWYATKPTTPQPSEPKPVHRGPDATSPGPSTVPKSVETQKPKESPVPKPGNVGSVPDKKPPVPPSKRTRRNRGR